MTTTGRPLVACYGEGGTVYLPEDGPLPQFGQIVCTHHPRRWYHHLGRRGWYFTPTERAA